VVLNPSPPNDLTRKLVPTGGSLTTCEPDSFALVRASRQPLFLLPLLPPLRAERLLLPLSACCHRFLILILDHVRHMSLFISSSSHPSRHGSSLLSSTDAGRTNWPSLWLPRSRSSSCGLVTVPLTAEHSLTSERLCLTAEITGGDGAEG
jgi:hypothetical protein